MFFLFFQILISRKRRNFLAKFKKVLYIGFLKTNICYLFIYLFILAPLFVIFWYDCISHCKLAYLAAWVRNFGNPSSPKIFGCHVSVRTTSVPYSRPLRKWYFKLSSILVPRVRAPFGQNQESRPLRPDRGLGPVSQKPRKLFGPVKPFLVQLYLKTEMCIRLKLLVWREPLFILRICE